MRFGIGSIAASAVSLLFALLITTMLSGCLPPERKTPRTLAAQAHPPHHAARINLFLTLAEKQGPAIQLEISSIEVLSNDLWLPLISDPVSIDSAVIGNAQRFLGGMEVQPGHYGRLRLTVAKGLLRKADGQMATILPDPLRIELDFGMGLSVETGDSKTLLFNWDVENSLLPNGRLAPKLFVAPGLRQLSANLVFVTCPEIDTVFIVRNDKNWVVDSFGLQGYPTYLAVEPSATRRQLYVLAPGEQKLKVVDMASQRVVDTFPTFNDDATFLTISPDGQWAYLLHERSGYLSRMNLRSGQIETRVMLGSRPVYATYLEQQNLLAVSLSQSQRVLLLNPVNLATVRSISTGSNPSGLLVADNFLYVAESGDSIVSKTDLANLGDTSRLMVGFGPRRLLDAGEQIFVSNFVDGSLSVLLPGQLGVVQDIYGLGRPNEMVYDQIYRRLYVADEKTSALAVIDVNSNQLLGRISLGAKPLGLALIQ